MTKITLPRSEFGEQEAFVQYLSLLKNKKQIVLFTAIPNSTWTPSKKQKNDNMRVGLHPGFPDLIIITKERVICIEMKVHPNKPTPEQIEWIKELTAHGVHTHVCYSYEEAKEVIDKYIMFQNMHFTS